MAESLITKKAIAGGLMELCQHKRFEKISIADITNICGLNRQTFYYHLQINTICLLGRMKMTFSIVWRMGLRLEIGISMC